MTRILLPTLVSTLLLSTFTRSAVARPGGRFSIELALMPSVEISHLSYGLGCLYGRCATQVRAHSTAAPHNTPYFQVSLWSDPHVALDFGFLAIHEPVKVTGKALWHELYEMGGSIDCGRTAWRLHPYAGPSVGFITSHYHHTRAMIGGRAGTRYFLNERWALRAEMAYRETIQDKGDHWRALGISAGLGFFP